MELKVGQRVKLVGGGIFSFDRIGNTGVVTHIITSSGFPSLIGVKLDGIDGPILGECDSWSYLENQATWVPIEEVEGESIMKLERNVNYELPTIELTEKFLEIAEENGFMWRHGTVPTKFNPWEEYSEDFCISVNEDGRMEYSPTDFYMENPNYPSRFIKFSELIEKPEEKKEEVVVENKFKVGDIVTGTLDSIYGVTNHRMTRGEVVSVASETSLIEVVVLEHEIPGYVTKDRYPVSSRFFELVEPAKAPESVSKPEILNINGVKIVFNAPYVIVTDGVKTGKAKCCKEDTFDPIIGLKLATERFNSARKPKVGDSVRVIKVDGKSKFLDHFIKIGTVATVTEDKSHIEDGAIEVYGVDKTCSTGTRIHQRLIKGEYEIVS